VNTLFLLNFYEYMLQMFRIQCETYIFSESVVGWSRRAIDKQGILELGVTRVGDKLKRVIREWSSEIR